MTKVATTSSSRRDDINDQVERRLRDRGVRYTTRRRAVVDALVRAHGPLSVPEIAAMVETAVPTSTTYRTLAVFEDAGVVTPHFGSKGLTRYELAEPLSEHHHHLVCTTCGSVEDVDVPEDIEHQLTAIARAVGDAGGYAASAHSLEVEGVCSRCT